MEKTHASFLKNPVTQIFTGFALLGFGAFAVLMANNRPTLAWSAYLINLLTWSAIAQGGVLFSMVMHMTKARWSHSLSGLSEAFTAFFPASFILFLFLLLGKDFIFPWLHEDLHGKAVWLNVPFLFSRDLIGLLVLYALGAGYLYYAIGAKLGHAPIGSSPPKIREFFFRKWSTGLKTSDRCQRRKSIYSVLYMIAFAFVLSLIAFDLIMSADPHWISTLFGAYGFVKAFYVGLGGLIILSAIVYLRNKESSGLKPAHFHDVGKLFFGFCLIWGDFFYAQFLVIWYGNIPEETSYIIQRTMLAPWKSMAWGVLIVCFAAPFLILLNRKIKTQPVCMSILCAAVIIGILLEHLLLLGPALSPGIGIREQLLATGVIAIGFLGLMGLCIGFFFRLFPELLESEKRGKG